ncbi:MAG: hypothetical protein R3C59_16885 [Planctomycetaceae bacterium]
MIHPAVKILTLVAAITSVGCSDSGSTDAGSIGESIGKNVTEFAQGVGTGVDTQMQITIELSQSLADAGVTHTVAKQQASLDNPEKAISVYLISTEPLKATLIAKAYNGDKQEIGRALADVQFSADDAQYVSFTFPGEMDRQTVTLYKIDLRP